MADKQVNVVTQKIPEKLLILRDRGIGLITRIYNIKKIQADPTLKPEFMSEKHLETPIKLLEKKFPDCKDAKILTAIRPLKQEISKALSSYYSTLLDVMHFRQCVDMLLNSIDSCRIYFDITANFDLTRLYLDVVCIYIRLMILLSRMKVFSPVCKMSEQCINGGRLGWTGTTSTADQFPPPPHLFL